MEKIMKVTSVECAAVYDYDFNDDSQAFKIQGTLLQSETEKANIGAITGIKL